MCIYARGYLDGLLEGDEYADALQRRVKGATSTPASAPARGAPRCCKPYTDTTWSPSSRPGVLTDETLSGSKRSTPAFPHLLNTDLLFVTVPLTRIPLSPSVVYGMFISRTAELSPLETELVVMAAITASVMPVQTMWHLRGTMRMGVGREDTRAIWECVRSLAVWSGADTAAWVGVEAVNEEDLHD